MEPESFEKQSIENDKIPEDTIDKFLSEDSSIHESIVGNDIAKLDFTEETSFYSEPDLIETDTFEKSSYYSGSEQNTVKIFQEKPILQAHSRKPFINKCTPGNSNEVEEPMTLNVCKEENGESNQINDFEVDHTLIPFLNENSRDSTIKENTALQDQNDKDIYKDSLLLKTVESLSTQANKNIGKVSMTTRAQREHMCCINPFVGIKLPYRIRKLFFLLTVVVLTVAKLIWDAVDVTIDAYLFYKLEMGEMINEKVYRNGNVNSAILAFSILGCLKILFWLRMIGVGKIRGMADIKNKDYLSYLTQLFSAVTFMLEDGPELLLEYFYVEKYMNKQILWYLLTKDAILCVIALYSVVITSIWLFKGLFRTPREKTLQKNNATRVCGITVHVGCCLLVGLSHFLRTLGASYQYVSSKVSRSCFEIEDGTLIQTPFAAGCMREIDYFIAVFCSMAILLSFLSVFTVNNLIHFLYASKTVDRPTFWQIGYYKCC